MNGAIAVPSVSTISVPNITKNNIIGANHHFFLSFKNSQNSCSIDILEILSPKS
jgi:hypothetical protein